jgi:hypothetical protein
MERAEAMVCPAVPEHIRKEVFLDVAEKQRSEALRDLAVYSEHIYEGWYDTDESIPQAYFRDDVDRPLGATLIPLYFTYLHSHTDADYASMGTGEQMFAAEPIGEVADGEVKDSKQ